MPIVVCKTADVQSSTMTENGRVFDEVRNATDVAPARAKPSTDFRAVKECSFSFTATKSSSMQSLVLLDDMTYDAGVVLGGGKDCFVPSRDTTYLLRAGVRSSTRAAK